MSTASCMDIVRTSADVLYLCLCPPCHLSFLPYVCVSYACRWRFACSVSAVCFVGWWGVGGVWPEFGPLPREAPHSWVSGQIPSDFTSRSKRSGRWVRKRTRSNPMLSPARRAPRVLPVCPSPVFRSYCSSLVLPRPALGSYRTVDHASRSRFARFRRVLRREVSSSKAGCCLCVLSVLSLIVG